MQEAEALQTGPYEVWDTATGCISEISGKSDVETACRHLEAGGVLYFPQSPVMPDEADRQFLLTQKQLEVSYHKNIAYRPQEDRLTGVSAKLNVDQKRLYRILKAYSQRSRLFLDAFLAPYAGSEADYATYRPVEEQGRKLRLRARNDLLHVDSFPTRPIFGSRILRFFTNLNPSENRVWQTSDPFDVLAPQFAQKIPLKPGLENLPGINRKPGMLAKFLKRLGIKQSGGSAYDDWMMNMHNAMKENADFQANCRKDRWEFPPGSAWIVLTDMVSHSVLSGQYALEQTLIVPFEKMVTPEKAPLNIIKRLTQRVG